MFQNLTEKINAAFKKFKNKGKLTEDDVKTGMREIKLALLEADVNFKVVREFIKKVTERAVGADVLESLLPAQQIVKIVNEELTALMGGENEKIHLNSRPPTVIMMVGLQGAGKTTHCGKLAGAFRKQGRRPLLVACDVYRPAAIKQLQVIGEQLDIPVYSEGTDVSPVEIAKAGIDRTLGQYFAALTNMRSVGCMGDVRTYDYAIALRAVLTSDFMTAESAELPWEVLGKVTSRIVNEVKGVNRVLYDCTGKPPATIEFE